MPRAAIGLGSNLGDRARYIREATAALAQSGAIVAVSSLYETDAIGGPEQGDYLNAVVLIDTEISPRQLLDRCLEIERAAGRERGERWGPRTLDVDILLYGDLTIDENDLAVPHPRMIERRFALDPLLEVWPDAVLPDGTPLARFRPAVADQKVREVPTLTADRVTSLILFLLVGLGAVAIWWLGDLLL